MFTRFEEFAPASMLGQPDSPPRAQGKLFFSQPWQRDVFGLTLALSKQGCFEWEAFREHLIGAIGRWEQLPCGEQPAWNYYECFLEALMAVLEEHSLIMPDEIEPATD